MHFRSSDSSHPGYSRNSFGMQHTASSVKRAVSFTNRTGGAFKDARPIMEREYQKQMQRKLQNFLVENSYSHAANEKMLMQPTKKDFVNIFEFLYRVVQADFKCSNKIEEEVPRLFRELGYPIAIKHSTMQTIGAPHTWPHMLAALVWLIDVYACLDLVNVRKIMWTEQEGMRKTMKYVDHVYCYLHYLKDTESGRNHEYYQTFDKNLCDQIQEAEQDENGFTVEDLERRVEQAQQEYDDLCNMPCDDARLDADADLVRQDIFVIRDHIEKQSLHRQDQLKQLETDKATRAAIEKEIGRLRREIANKERVISTQAISGEAGRSLSLKREELKREVKVMRDEADRLNSDRWEIEQRIAKTRTTIHSRQLEFLRRAETVIDRMVPRGTDWRSQIEIAKSPFDVDFGAYAQETLKPKLRQLMTFGEDQIDAMTEEMRDVEMNVQRLQDQLETCEDDISSVRSRIAEIDMDFDVKKQDWADERHRAKVDLDVARNEHEVVKGGRSMEVKELYEQLASIQKERTVKERELHKSYEDHCKKITPEITTIMIDYQEMEDVRKEAHLQDEELLSMMDKAHRDIRKTHPELFGQQL
uniref:Kinetochore protein NDC80 n=1 Tax=Plectus sambesii TaxID=2011161 RepID=A0A914WGD3_9BILA